MISICGVFLIVALFVYLKIKSTPIDYLDPDKVLAKTEVLLAYKRKKQAIALLKKAYEENPSNTTIAAKLYEVQQHET